MKNLFYSFFYFALTLSIYSIDYDQQVAARIVELFKKDYDQYEDKSFAEKLVLKLGKESYFETLDIWLNYVHQIEEIEIKTDPRINKLISKVKKHASEGKAERLSQLFCQLTFLSYCNYESYLQACLEHETDINPCFIDEQYIEKAFTKSKYYQFTRELYETEAEIKKEIKEIISKDGLKSKLPFYNLVFDFLNKIRQKVIDRHLEKMEKAMN
ncbi:MAG: hypothetical protein MJB14_07105 [Spirochaetes bacterium]|nr:hypothetical protein [Spirochaetota bacterium]